MSSRLMKSSSTSLLRGTRLDGKVISKVMVDGRSDKRIVYFKDGSKTRLSRSEVAAMCRLVGLRKQIEKYQKASPAEKRLMIHRSKRRQASLIRNALSRVKEKLSRARSKASKSVLQKRYKELKSLTPRNIYKGEGGVTGIIYGQAKVERRMAKRLEGQKWITVKKGLRKIRVPVGVKRRKR